MQGVAVIGLGCSGLPLLKESGKHGRALGFDVVEVTVANGRIGTELARVRRARQEPMHGI